MDGAPVRSGRTPESRRTMLETQYRSRIKMEGNYYIYQSNLHILTSEDISKVTIEIQDVNHFRKIQLITHSNLLGILEVSIKGGMTNVYYEKLNPRKFSDLLPDLLVADYFRNVFANNRSENNNFRAIISDMIDGLVELHSNDLYHGDLRIETVCTLFNYFERPLIKLGGFKRRVNVSVLEMVKFDWQSLGYVLEALVKEIRNDLWDDDLMLVELKDLCARLKFGKFGDSEMKQNPSMLSKSIKIFVYRHPALLKADDRPNYLLLGVAFLKMKKNRYLLPLIKTQDVLIPGKTVVDHNLHGLLLNCNALRVPLIEANADYHGFYFVFLVRNLSAHIPQNKGKQIEGVVGETPVKIDEYFRSTQPKVILALYNVLKDTSFKFDA